MPLADLFLLQNSGQLIALCTSKLSNQPQLLSGVLQMLASTMSNGTQTIKLDDFVVTDGELTDLGDIAIDKIVPALAKIIAKKNQQVSGADAGKQTLVSGGLKRPDGLPKHIVSIFTRSGLDQRAYR